MDAPTGVPNGTQLHARAQKSNDETAAGSDGWRPIELKAQPVRAWDHRAALLNKCTELCKYRTAHYTVNMSALKKKENSVKPLEHRLLTIFSSLYRTETGAWYDMLMPWIRTILHPDVIGALSGWEALDVAWDAAHPGHSRRHRDSADSTTEKCTTGAILRWADRLGDVVIKLCVSRQP